MRNDGKRVTTAAYRHNYPDYETRYSIPLYTTPPTAQTAYDQTALELCNVCGWKTLIPDDVCLNCEYEKNAAQPAPDEEKNT
jgi:hypothetical protein